MKRGLAIAGVILGAMSAPAISAESPTQAPRFSDMTCELHVWAMGRPNFHPKPNAFIRITPPTDADRADPNSTVNVFNGVKRVAAFSETQLNALFPGARSVRIVRHDQVIDMDTTPLASIKAPLAARAGECYADLVVANLYALFASNKPYSEVNPAVGPVGDAIVQLMAGGDRMVIDFWLQQWPARKGVPFVFRRKNDTPLPHVRPGTSAMADAARASADLNLAKFAADADAARRR
ncbi:MAG: hypothetical protein K2W81_04460 [Sphingomonas sp.]|uniref:hypothetical protein n=1 Tax=Sphingomonas sp. TaxID=28214 RepID=UPI0025D66379|nr:hypothetical protein [Sphingomonas sp.]MBY0283199.1 hypothetical protein [Sphingomonas sp.]